MLMRFPEAISKTLEVAMEQDSSVFLYGCDVGDHTASFGSTLGLRDKFGKDRVFSTPISEESMLGVGIGAAMNGMRPVNIHIRADFLLLAMNQLINMAATIEDISSGLMQVPLTVRAIVGRGWGQGAQHSKSIHSLLSHFPGLEVFVPTGPQSAHDLLLHSIYSDQPSIIFEHRWLYDISAEVQLQDRPKPLEDIQWHQLHHGDDLTIVACGWMAIEALHAAKALAGQGVQCDVFALHDLKPNNDLSVIESIHKTGRAIVADYDWAHCGMGESLAYRLTNQCFSVLKRPIPVLGFKDQHVPTARHLEKDFYPNSQDILIEAAHALGRPSLAKIDHQPMTYEDRFKGPF